MKHNHNEASTPTFDYPVVPQYPTVRKFETPDGPVIIDDEYAWLAHHDTDPEAADVIAAQNALTSQYLEHVGTVQRIYNELERLTNSDTKYSVPEFQGNSLVWMRREPTQQHWVAMRQCEGQDAEVIIDPNELSEGASIRSLDYSPAGKHLLYSLDQSGDEVSRVYIRNTQTGLETHFYTGRIFKHAWDADDAGFVYVKSLHAEYDVKDPSQYQKVYHHSLEAEDADQLLFDPSAYDIPPHAWLNVSQTDDGKRTYVSARISKDEIRQYAINNTTNETVELLAGSPGAHDVQQVDNYIYVATDHGADNKRVVRSHVSNCADPIEAWEEFLPERPDQQFQRLAFSRDYAIVEYTHNTASVVELRDRQTNALVSHIEMPELTSLRELSASPDKQDFYYSISNCFKLEEAYHFDGSKSQKIWEDSRAMDPEKVQITQEWCTLPDGSKQPMFVMAPKDGLRDQLRPLWIEGYGGFAAGSYPSNCYNDLRRIWVEQGGIAVEPCLPGGDEFGKQWHRKATKANRQVAFDGMIAAIEHCIDTGMTTPDMVALSGGSNGGLMAAAVGMQRPDLIRTVNSRVPLLDMYDYTNHLIANLWIPEYGDPNNPEEFGWLAYSPYHNFDPNAQYPSFFFSASARDGRVHPVHAFKMAARMQTGKSANPIMLRSDKDSGHNGGKGISHRLMLQAERLAFLMHEVGIVPNFEVD